MEPEQKGSKDESLDLLVSFPLVNDLSSFPGPEFACKMELTVEKTPPLLLTEKDLEIKKLDHLRQHGKTLANAQRQKLLPRLQFLQKRNHFEDKQMRIRKYEQLFVCLDGVRQHQILKKIIELYDSYGVRWKALQDSARYEATKALSNLSGTRPMVDSVLQFIHATPLTQLYTVQALKVNELYEMCVKTLTSKAFCILCKTIEYYAIQSSVEERNFLVQSCTQLILGQRNEIFIPCDAWQTICTNAGLATRHIMTYKKRTAKLFKCKDYARVMLAAVTTEENMLQSQLRNNYTLYVLKEVEFQRSCKEFFKTEDWKWLTPFLNMNIIEIMLLNAMYSYSDSLESVNVYRQTVEHLQILLRSTFNVFVHCEVIKFLVQRSSVLYCQSIENGNTVVLVRSDKRSDFQQLMANHVNVYLALLKRDVKQLAMASYPNIVTNRLALKEAVLATPLGRASVHAQSPLKTHEIEIMTEWWFDENHHLFKHIFHKF